MVGAVLTKVRGIVETVADESVTLLVDPFEIEILIPEHTRRPVQSKLGEPITLHTIFYIEGGAMVSRLIPRLVGFLSPIDREFFEIFCSVDGVGVQEGAAGDGPAGPRAGADDPGPGRQAARDVSRHRRGDRRADRGQAAAEGRQVRLDRRPRGRPPAAAAESNGAPENAEPDVIRDTYAALLSVGHSESEARQAIDRVLSGQEEVQVRRRYDRSDLSAKSMNRRSEREPTADRSRAGRIAE